MNKVYRKFIFVSMCCTFLFIIALNNHHTILEIITSNLKLLPKHNYTRISKMSYAFGAHPSTNVIDNAPNCTEYSNEIEGVLIPKQVAVEQKKFDEIMKQRLETYNEKLKKNFKVLEENLKKNIEKFDVTYEEKFRLEKNLIDDIVKDTYCENNNLTATKKVIIIVPYRDRADNLKLFLSPLHKHLMDQVKIRNVKSNVLQLKSKIE